MHVTFVGCAERSEAHRFVRRGRDRCAFPALVPCAVGFSTSYILFLLTGKGCGLYGDIWIWSQTSTRNLFGLVQHIDRLDLVDRDGRTIMR